MSTRKMGGKERREEEMVNGRMCRREDKEEMAKGRM